MRIVEDKFNVIGSGALQQRLRAEADDAVGPHRHVEEDDLATLGTDELDDAGCGGAVPVVDGLFEFLGLPRLEADDVAGDVDALVVAADAAVGAHVGLGAVLVFRLRGTFARAEGPVERALEL